MRHYRRDSLVGSPTYNSFLVYEDDQQIAEGLSLNLALQLAIFPVLLTAAEAVLAAWWNQDLVDRTSRSEVSTLMNQLRAAVEQAKAKA